MAAPGRLPLDALKKRALLNDPAPSPERLEALGREFFSRGLLTDALECFARAESREGLGEVAARALKEGDLFVFRLAKKALGEEPDTGALMDLAENAKAAGKLVHARKAYEQAGAHDKASGVMKDTSKKRSAGELH